jgi:hypothetical protein
LKQNLDMILETKIFKTTIPFFLIEKPLFLQITMQA